MAALAAAGCAVFARAAAAAAPGGPATIQGWSGCRLEHPERLSSVEAQCATLWVPLDRDAAVAGGAVNGSAARTDIATGIPASHDGITLKIARVPALNRRSTAAPLFLLAGGPGQSAIDLYAAFAGAFARIHLNRDIVLVDQRGTGSSSPLPCKFPEDWSAADNTPAAIAAATRRCLSELGPKVRYFTTAAAVRDLEDVRRALGLAQIDLYAASYGTRVAESYVRDYPDRVQAMILDGVIDPEQAVGPSTPLDGERALESILDRCHTTPDCARAYPDLQAEWLQLKARFGETKVPIKLAGTEADEPQPLEFDRGMFGAGLRLLSYSGVESSLMPYLLHQTYQGNVLPLASLAVRTARKVGDQLALGMQNSVICSEDWPLIAARGFDRAPLQRTYLGTDQLDALEKICAIWPRGPVSPKLHAPLKSDVPTLLLSGEADPVTPPAAAARVARLLSRSRHLVLAGEGHGQLATGCMPRLMAAFLDRPDPAALDTTCLKQHRPAPFFISINGPSP